MRQGRSALLVLFWLTLLAGSVFLFFLGLGTVRYGSVDGLVLRIRSEVIARQPHPQFVPTPVGLASVNSANFASDLVTPLEGQGALPTPTPVFLASAAYNPAAGSVALTGFRHAWQTWNNCGPATITTNLSYYNHYLDQSDAALVLKPNSNDKNVNPDELVAFAQSQGFNARTLVNGDAHRLRLLLSNGIPVLVETWLEPEPNDGLGHYRLFVGYDDAVQEWIVSDSYISDGLDRNGPYHGIRVPYAEMDSLWSVFNRTHIVVYPNDMAPVVHAIIGDDMSTEAMWQKSLNRFQAEIQSRPNDPFIWFNLGSTLVAMGHHEQAAIAYDQARQIGLPWRMLWYQFGPFQAYYETGRYQELIQLADATISSGGEIEEVYFWKGRALVALDNTAGATEAWRQALTIKPTYIEAQAALASIN